jgi:hypothetical protein
MRRLHHGIVLARLRPLLALGGALAAAIAAAGCATSTAGGTAQFRYAARAERTITEDDGLPAQVALPLGIRQLADDPSEPFSRNYGPQPVMRLRAALTRLSDAEADALIAHAITEHEMRRP